MKNESPRWRSPLRGRLWWLVAIPVLLLAAYVVVARQLMLLVPDYRQELEAVLEEHLGFAIVIEQLDGPVLELVRTDAFLEDIPSSHER